MRVRLTSIFVIVLLEVLLFAEIVAEISEMIELFQCAKPHSECALREGCVSL